VAAVEKAAAVLEASTERASPAYVTYSFFFIFDKRKVGKRKKNTTWPVGEQFSF